MRVGFFCCPWERCVNNKQALSLFRLRLFKHALNQIPLTHAAIANTQAFPVEFLEDLDKNRQPAHNGVNSLGRDMQNRVDERAAMPNDVAQHAIHIVARNFFARSARHNTCVHFRKRANGATDTVEFLGRASTGARFVGGNKPANARANGRNLVLGGQNVAHETPV